MIPVAICFQNSRSISRRCRGAPGDFIGDRPVNSVIHPAGLPINTSVIKVLRRPVESSLRPGIRMCDQSFKDRAAIEACHLECVEHHVGAHVISDAPSNDLA